MTDDPTATDAVWRRNEIESPCRKICVIEPASGLCIGCLRTRDEIAAWGRMTPDARRETMAGLDARAPLLSAAKRRARAGRTHRKG